MSRLFVHQAVGEHNRDAFMLRVRVTDECWLWTGKRLKEGYGIVSGPQPERKQVLAHRLSYELFVGPVGEHCVLHRCDTPACVRPDHLFLGSVGDNNRDCFEKNRHPFIVPTGAPCRRCGGPLTRMSNGKRRCRRCRNELDRRYYARRKALA